MISILDYGMANLRSVQKAFERLGHAARIISSPAEVKGAERLVVPGVGAFRDAIARARSDGPFRGDPGARQKRPAADGHLPRAPIADGRGL